MDRIGENHKNNFDISIKANIGQRFAEEDKSDNINLAKSSDNRFVQEVGLVAASNLNSDENELEQLIYNEDEAGSKQHNKDNINQLENWRNSNILDQNTLNNLKSIESELHETTKTKLNANHIDVLAKDASNGLSYSKLMQRIDRTHPRKIKDGKLVQYPFFSTSTGWNLPCYNFRKTDMKEFGSGICIYFKWLKYIICVFLVASIISIPLFVFFIGASTSTYTDNKSLETLLDLTTLGNMGSPTTSCGKANNLKSKTQLLCSSGVISEISKIGTEIKGNKNSNCKSNGAYLVVDPACDYSTIGTPTKNSLDFQFNSFCYGHPHCQIDLSKVSWPSTCNTQSAAYLKVICASQTIMGTSRHKIAYIVITFDLLCIFFIWFAFEVHEWYENNEDQEINDAVLDGSDFTVEISNIPAHGDIRILKAQIWKYIEGLVQKDLERNPSSNNDPNLYKIAQCNLALTKYSIMSNYKTKMKHEKDFKILEIKENILKNSKVNSKILMKEHAKIEKKRRKLKAKYDTNEITIAKLRHTFDVRAVKIYITMQSMEGQRRLLEISKSKKLRRCCGIIKTK